jgi:8-oxo-dGTP pyrophosphatase MutT (NUDIX family)
LSALPGAERPPQRIPRPPGARPGPPAPWAALPPSALAGLSMARVRAALRADPLAGTVVGRGERQAAVLVALFEENGEARVVLTRRASTLRSHTSEVSFPGGQADPGESLADAAQREAWEEVGLDPADVELIASLGSLTTVSSGALITPFVGILPGRPSLSANPREVDRVFDVALADLLVGGVHHSEIWQRGDIEMELQFYDVPGDIIWGATARVLTELLTRVTAQTTPPRPER